MNSPDWLNVLGLNLKYTCAPRGGRKSPANTTGVVFLSKIVFNVRSLFRILNVNFRINIEGYKNVIEENYCDTVAFIAPREQRKRDHVTCYVFLTLVFLLLLSLRIRLEVVCIVLILGCSESHFIFPVIFFYCFFLQPTSHLSRIIIIYFDR